jgi:hypothetical protein
MIERVMHGNRSYIHRDMLELGLDSSYAYVKCGPRILKLCLLRLKKMMLK